MLFNYPVIPLQEIISALTKEKNIVLQVLRLDTVHPIISGNKIFKLHYFLDDPENKMVVTFGGAYSNHLVATAFACNQKNTRCIGIVRGEKPKELSHTLKDCIHYGMQLRFITRNEYDKKESPEFINSLKNEYGDCIIIPEGGYDKKGALGAAAIIEHIDDSFTHICCAIGTATTVAGLLLKSRNHQKVIGIPVLKGMAGIEERIFYLTGKNYKEQLHIEANYHFGGYAKKNAELIEFMNELYHQHQLPTDFVYTAKMMYAVTDLIKKGFFEPGSKICCVHTGGLQGNLSLSKGTLTF